MDDKKMRLDAFTVELNALLEKYNASANICCFVFDAKKDENGNTKGSAHVRTRGKFDELIQMIAEEILCMASGDYIRALKYECMLDKDFTKILAAKAAEKFSEK